MMIHEIQSLDLPELEPYRTLRRPHEHIQKGIFVAEGEKVVRRLLDSKLTVLSLLLTSEWHMVLKEQYPLNVPQIFIGERKLLETIVGYPLHQGIMAVARVPEEPSIEDLIRSRPDPYLLIALDGIVSAENVGVIVRNAGAFGVHGILADATSSSPYLRRAVRNSMGAVFRIPVLHVRLTQVLPKLNCKVIATIPESDQSITGTDLSGNLCVVFGNEGSGISESVLQQSHLRVSIPMCHGIDSLNVASASAVLLYEIHRKLERRAASTSGANAVL